ncbi:hypothetical protein X777_01715 [Ooceraea biroi]|uniref:Uncharacterized protein n=1 Tax=Ooceraea biroi TaxID=2015173 RepID=A0A026WPW4_OOCBI|nr:hypothetical protein X777_01715 [Ooceraea biroi]
MSTFPQATPRAICRVTVSAAGAMIPCLIWLSTVRSDTGMHTAMPDGMPSETEKMSDSMLLKAKRDSIHQPCGPVYPAHVPAYSPPPVYAKPYVQQTYLKKELGVAPSHLSHLQYIQQPPAYATVVAKPSVTYVKPAAPAVNYHNPHQSVQYIKPIAPVYHKPMLSYAPIYQKPLYYAPMYHGPMYHDHAMPKIFLKKYDVPQVVAPIYQKPLVHAPAIQYATPKVVQVQAPQLFLLVVAVCEAGRIPRGVVHEPNFQAIYHGHGATSYQNVQVDSHDSIIVPTNYGDQAELLDLKDHEYHQPIIPIVETHNDVDHIDISDSAPYEEFTIADVKLKSDVLSHYLDHDDDKHDFDFHLRK